MTSIVYLKGSHALTLFCNTLGYIKSTEFNLIHCTLGICCSFSLQEVKLGRELRDARTRRRQPASLVLRYCGWCWWCFVTSFSVCLKKPTTNKNVYLVYCRFEHLVLNRCPEAESLPKRRMKHNIGRSGPDPDAACIQGQL